MINSISKEKLPKNCGYILKTEQLNMLLTENNITTHTDLNYHYSKEPGCLLRAYYWFPNKNIPYYRIYIQSGSFLSADIKSARKAMSDIVLPEFIMWLNHILSLSENSTLFNVQPTFSAYFKNGEVNIKKDTE